ncbi:MAG TPA: hypothetical protein VEX38_04755 [Fimbriimonadaceae bacterium]|nr:hypothetical protein [Fimbriimonadaceae bacterium]
MSYRVKLRKVTLSPEETLVHLEQVRQLRWSDVGIPLAVILLSATIIPRELAKNDLLDAFSRALMCVFVVIWTWKNISRRRATTSVGRKFEFTQHGLRHCLLLDDQEEEWKTLYWEDVQKVERAGGGVLLISRDGETLTIPARAFPSPTERDLLVQRARTRGMSGMTEEDLDKYRPQPTHTL